jgi:elongation factor P--(R)-beta-lysine ligase
MSPELLRTCTSNQLHSSKIDILKDRAACLTTARAFFTNRKILEVDTPLLGHFAPVDEHIDVFKVILPSGSVDRPFGYLHSSPEYAMKRLLSEGIGDIYQLSHVFREGEVGKLHNPEFTMVEWYRVGMDYASFIEETLDFLRNFLGDLPSESISYRQALKTFAGIDYVYASQEELLSAAKAHGITLNDAEEWNQETLLHLLLSSIVEPHLGQEKLTILWEYPATEAALARTRQKGDEVIADRFEIYHRGLELCNGYYELVDPIEQKRRFLEANQARVTMGKTALPIDEFFIGALEKGMPECCGVAVGFDRLMLLRHQATHLDQVLPFSWTSF